MRYVVDGLQRVNLAAQAVSSVQPTASVLAMPQPTPIAFSALRRLDGLSRFRPNPDQSLATDLVMDPFVPMTAGAAVAGRLTSRLQWLRSIWAAAVFCAVAAALFGIVVTLRLTQAQSTANAAAGTATKPAPAQIAAPVPIVNLQTVVDQFAASETTAPMGIYVKDLQTGQVASSNDNQVMITASLYKLFVAMVIYHRIDAGQLDYAHTTETGANITDCLHDMITWSDNACGVALGDMIGWQAQNDFVHSMGFVHTDMTGPLQHSTASDVGLFMEKLYNGTLLSPNSTANFLALLKAQQHNDRFPIGLPAGTVIAHKTGDIYGYWHDAGIVYGPKSNFIIVATSGPWNDPNAAMSAEGTLASKVWAALEK